MARRSWNPTIVGELLDRFVAEEFDLSTKSWDDFSKRVNGPASGSVVKHLGGRTFSHLVCAVAMKADQARSFAWPICPEGHRHSEELWQGTGYEYGAGACYICQSKAARSEERRLALPTFAELYPGMVQHLADPADASTKGLLVSFRCGTCATDDVKWSPDRGGVPTCVRCQVTRGSGDGEVVRRKGGGVEVVLEAKVAEQLARRGIPAWSNLGVVVRPGAYIVDVPKPDVVIPELHVAVEIDHRLTRLANRHLQDDGVTDDKRRDEALAAVGWRVLRVRRPGYPTYGTWPWRLETTSESPRVIADGVLTLLKHENLIRIGS